MVIRTEDSKTLKFHPQLTFMRERISHPCQSMDEHPTSPDRQRVHWAPASRFAPLAVTANISGLEDLRDVDPCHIRAFLVRCAKQQNVRWGDEN